MALQAQGKRKDSERCLKTAIEKEKSNPENYRALGTLMLDRGLFDDALMLFELASMFKPSPENLFMTAIADLMLGKEEDAELLMKRAVATNKDKTVEVAKGFFESNYAKDTSIPEEEKKKLKAQIERLTRSL